MLDWLIVTTLEVSVLIGVVLLARPLIRRAFGAVAAGDLWLIPAVGVLLPTRPPRPETVLETIQLPGAEVSRGFYSAVEAWEAPTAIPWVTLWLVGVGVWLAVQLVRSVRFRRTLLASAVPFVPSSLGLKALLDRHGFDDARVLTTTLPGAPFVAGLFNARVFLPADFERRFSVQEQQWILVHELTHVRRGDLWARLIAEGFRAVFWFNPLMHLAVRLLREDQEYACDQAVVSRCTAEERYRYGRALVLGASAESRPSFATFFRNNKERYAMLGKYRESTFNTVAGAITCLAIGVLALTSAPSSVAQDAPGAYNLNAITELNAEIHMARMVQGESTLRVLAPDQAGKVQEWTVVLPSAMELINAGYKLTFFAPGHGYVIAGYPSMDIQEHRFFAMSVTRPDGSVWSR
jgi:beta-lactamase regulating signal transducer with metallopeptidase domain